jgi:ankyrin repeat protein
MTKETTLLQNLLDASAKKDGFSNEKKAEAMALVAQGADFNVTSTVSPQNTLMHLLVESHIKEALDNSNEISRLAKLDKNTLHKKNGLRHVPLQLVIDQFSGGHCSLEHFKKTLLLLASLGADFSVQGTTTPHTTALHLLILNDNDNEQEIFDLVVKNKINVNVKDCFNLTPLQKLIEQFDRHQCTLEKFKKMAMLLANHGASLTEQGGSYFSAAVLHHLVATNKEGINNQEISDLCKLEKKLVNSVNEYKESPLQIVLKRFDDYQADINSLKATAMLLVELGADFTVRCNQKSHHTLLHHLLRKNNEGCHDQEIAALVAISKKSKKNLFKIPNGDGSLPLQTWLQSRPDITVTAVQEMLDMSSALHYVHKNQQTALHSCAISGNLAVAQYLCTQGLPLNAVDTKKQTMLHLAVHHKNQEYWQWLYEHGIDLNQQDNDENTALMLAVQKNNAPMVQWLIQKGANLKLTNTQGKTALKIAKDKKLEPIIALLTEGLSPEETLYVRIEEMHQYGKRLEDKGIAKGKIMSNLADALKIKADAFFHTSDKATHLAQFKEEFNQLLSEKNRELCEYRAEWSTILKNTLIALTGIGLVAIGAKLTYSALYQERPLFFFQKPKTTSEEKATATASAVTDLKY